MGDKGDDVAGDIRWLTYREIGEIRGISAASATRLVIRRKWRRQAGNDGTVRVAVPTEEAQRQGDKPRDSHGDISRTIRALETAVSTLGKQLDAERGRADKAEAALASEREARTRAESAAAQLRQQDQARRSAGLVERIITALRPPR